MKNLGATRKILGMKILRDRETCSICLSQERYVKKVLFKFEMKNAQPIITPFANHFKLFAFQSPKIEVDCEKMKNIQISSQSKRRTLGSY